MTRMSEYTTDNEMDNTFSSELGSLPSEIQHLPIGHPLVSQYLSKYVTIAPKEIVDTQQSNRKHSKQSLANKQSTATPPKKKAKIEKNAKLKKAANYTVEEWETALELFTNGDYAKMQDVSKTSYTSKDFWTKVCKLLGRESFESVRKAFGRGPEKWVKEYNQLRGPNNTGGKAICFRDIVGCKESGESLAQSVVEQFAEALGMSTKGGATFVDNGKFTTIREFKPPPPTDQDDKLFGIFESIANTTAQIAAQHSTPTSTTPPSPQTGNTMTNLELNEIAKSSTNSKIKDMAEGLLLKRLENAMNQ